MAFGPSRTRSSPTRPRRLSTLNSEGRRITLSPTWRKTGESPGCSVRSRLSPSTLRSVRALTGRVIRRSPIPSGGEFGPLNLHADQLELVVAEVDPGLQDDDGVVIEQGAVLGHGLREDEHLDRGLEVLEHEGRHELALLGVAPAQVGDHPADRRTWPSPKPPGPAPPGMAVASRSTSRSSAKVQSTSRAERPLEAHEGVVAHVQAEHLLLEGQALGLVELGVGDLDAGVGEAGARCRAAPGSRAAKSETTPASCSRRRSRVRSTISSKTRQRPFGGGRGSRSPRLDQRLDRALVEHLRDRPAGRSRRSRRTARRARARRRWATRPSPTLRTAESRR